MATNITVQYIDFGITSARDFWGEIAAPAYERFKGNYGRAAAIEASLSMWHVHEWIWHEGHPGEDTRRNQDYLSFRDSLIDQCPQLAWVRDIAEAAKHRGLGRAPDVQQMRDQAGKIYTIGGKIMTFGGKVYTFGSGLKIVLTDESVHDVRNVLETVFAFWEARFANAQDLP